MIQPVIHDPILLAKKSDEATRDDLFIAQDLLDTLLAYRESCVGMAANMIGALKRIIAFDNQGNYMVMINPKIVQQSGLYETEEGCLSLNGIRKTMRYEKIKVEYQTRKLEKKTRTFTGWEAQIIQHEIDHCDGILI